MNRNRPIDPPQPGSLHLRYLGQSCTLLSAPDGTTIVSDPYRLKPSYLGALPRNLTAHAVTVSHTHPDHNHVKAVGGAAQVLSQPGAWTVGAVKVTGYGTLEGSPTGESHMPMTVFVFEAGGVKFVHLGDAGVVPEEDALAAMEDADAVLVNVDDYVIPLDRFLPFMARIRARCVLPSHYNDAPTFEDGVSEFLRALPPGVEVLRGSSDLLLTPGMPRQLLLLDPLRRRA